MYNMITSESTLLVLHTYRIILYNYSTYFHKSINNTICNHYDIGLIMHTAHFQNPNRLRPLGSCVQMN